VTALPPPGTDDPVVGPDLTGFDPIAEVASGPEGRHRFWRTFLSDGWAMAGLAFLVVVVAAAVFAPLVAPDSYSAQDLVAINAAPSLHHLLGTDDLGRDVLSRIIWGGRVSLRATFEIVVLAIVVALPLGLLAGFLRGWVDTVTMRVMDALFSFPPLVLALTVSALLGASLNNAAVAIAIVFVPSFVRLIRGEVIAVREEAYVESARSLGARPGRIMRTHVLPNVASPIIIQVALALGFALLAEAGLSFLGIGVEPPTPSWGNMLNEAYQFIFQAPWALVFPGLAIMLTVLSFNMVADGLRDAIGIGSARVQPRGIRTRLRERRSEDGWRPGSGRGGAGTAAPENLPPSGPEIATTLSPAVPPPIPAAPIVRDDLLLSVENLRVEFDINGRSRPVVEGLSFSVGPGRTLGLVGESGSGKTVSALAIMGLLPRRVARVTQGSVHFEGRNLLELDARSLRSIRGDRIAMIFQDPMSSLNPAFSVGNQIAEQVRAHRDVTRTEAKRIAVEMLGRVEIPEAARRAGDHPHQFSGGMRQRVMIAMALSCSPQLLIADEPTTALDVTTESQILDLLHTLSAEESMAMIFVTHDLGVIAEVADEVVVMYAGQKVEQAPSGSLFVRPRHPYTEALLSSMPQSTPIGEALPVIRGVVPRPEDFPVSCRFRDRCDYAVEACATTVVELRPAGWTVGGEMVGGAADTDRTPAASARCLRQDELHLAGARLTAGAGGVEVDPVLPRADAEAPRRPEAPSRPDAPSRPEALRVRGLAKRFVTRSGVLQRVTGGVDAVDDVSLDIPAGTTLGLVGESGSGKSTLARLVVRIVEPSAGSVVVDGTDVTALRGSELGRSRRQMQMVFQDPFSSLDPNHTIGDTVSEPLVLHTALSAEQRRARTRELLALVGLGAVPLDRFPHQFSGGQRQRIAIARALAVNPSLLVCDEAVSALDVSTQAQVLNLLSDLQRELGTAYLFISHDLSVVRHIADRIAVMYLGQIVEEGPARQVLEAPTHPYTAALLSAIPVPDPAVARSRRRLVLPGEVETGGGPVAGCRFAPRCAFAMDICRQVDPAPFHDEEGTTVRCHLHTTGPGLAGRSVWTLPPPAPTAAGTARD
jgi:peptide/nickel transport system ATP-binding protein